MENKILKFEQMELSNEIKKALRDIRYETPTEIQEKTIPYILDGKDMLGQSKTGTGKTAAFGLPILNNIDPENKNVQAIVLCPTRELANQVADEIKKFNKYQEGIKTLAIYGGQDIETQIRMLKRKVQIVIGTPGRVMDHMRRKTLKLNDVKMVVLDEADEMLNMGFEEDIVTILKDVPLERQTILFSATMNKRILEIANKYLTNPKRIKIQSKELTVENIEQTILDMKQGMKDEALVRLIDKHNPKKAIVFCNTKKKVDNLIEMLKKKGYKAEALHGDIKQSTRERIMKRLKNNEFQILVATDVAARGIDIEELELVVNYDIPQEEEYYIHRIGRTGRNGKSGKAYTFVVGKEKSKIYNIQKYANTKITQGTIPTLEEITTIKNEKIVNQIQDIIDTEDFSNTELLDLLLKQNKDIKKITMALLTMLTPKEKKEVYKTYDGRNVRLFLNLGRKDKIMAKDIVGSISSNVAMSGSDIGKINILDKFSFIEVPGNFTNEVIQGMKGKQIKGRDVNIEVANG